MKGDDLMTEQMAGGSIALERLEKGMPPGRGALLEKMTAGLDPLTAFLCDQYLENYISRGGSKMKFVTGRSGSGKTHFSMRMLDEAAARGFLTVSFSAKDVWLHDFREIYLEILRQCDIEHILQGCADQIVRELGYDPAQIGPGKSFMDHLSEKGEADPISRGEIRSALRSYFTKNPLLDNNFACCCSILTGGEVVHRAGYRGLIVCIDDLEMVMNRAAGSAMRYTKLRRNDAFESIRQLIDDIDNMRYIMFLFGFERGLMDNENTGFKTYQALWMRIQNEVVSTRFNRFADIIDLDRYAEEFYTEDVLIEMSGKIAQVLSDYGRPAKILDKEKAGGLLERSKFGGIGLPYLVVREVLSEDN